MKLYGVLVLLVTLSAACGLICYSCGVIPEAVSNDCMHNTTICHPINDRCFVFKYNGFIAKGCSINPQCKSPFVCCTGDLCNSAITTGSSVLLLLLSSAITPVFL